MAHRESPRSTPARRALAASRRGRITALALALAFLTSASGCMVMDELDSASAKMPTNTKYNKEARKRDPSGESLGAAGRLAAAKNATLARSRQWWGEAKTMTPGEQPAGIVSCRLPEGLQFMTVDDCRTQGGHPSSKGS